MEKKFEPHYILILISTLKATGVLLIFFAVAVLSSPTKVATIFNLVRVLVPVVLITYVYIMLFWKGITFETNGEKFDFRMKTGRKRHIEIYYSDIENIELKEGFLEKLFNVSRLSISLKGKEKIYADDTMVLNQYLVFKKDEAKEILSILKLLQ